MNTKICRVKEKLSNQLVFRGQNSGVLTTFAACNNFENHLQHWPPNLMNEWRRLDDCQMLHERWDPFSRNSRYA